jgi:hypothetical protein
MIQSDFQYFGTISFIQHLYTTQKVYLNPNLPFTKMSFKNRCVIASSQGPLTLSIPLIGGRDQKIPIQDIRIAYNAPWREQHLRAFIVNYKRAPFFEYYEQSLVDLYQQKPDTLIEFLMACHIWVHQQIKAPWIIVSEMEESLPIYDVSCNNDETDHSNKGVYVHYTSPYTPKNYTTYQELAPYQQVFSDKTGFLNNLCILDKLFCEGGPNISKQWAQ